MLKRNVANILVSHNLFGLFQRYVQLFFKTYHSDVTTRIWTFNNLKCLKEVALLQLIRFTNNWHCDL